MHVRSVVVPHSHYCSTLPVKHKNKNTRDTLDLGAAVVGFSLTHYLYFFQALDSLIDTTVMASSSTVLLLLLLLIR